MLIIFDRKTFNFILGASSTEYLYPTLLHAFAFREHSVNRTSPLCMLLQAEKVHNQDLYFKKTVKYVGEPMSHLESIASSAVLLFFNLSVKHIHLASLVRYATLMKSLFTLNVSNLKIFISQKF